MDIPLLPVACPRGIAKLVDREAYLEAPVFVSEVIKVNDHYQAQKRIAVITPRAFYNMKRSFFGWYSVQRSFPLSCIEGLIRNPNTQEFVLKVDATLPNDYRFRGDCLEAITVVLLKLKPNLQVWTLCMNLDVYVRRKGDDHRPGSFHLSFPSMCLSSL